MPIPTAQQIDDFASAPTRITAALSDLSEAQFQYKASPNEWSIQEIVLHLPDSEAGGYWRLRKALAETEPTLQVYDQEAWARNLSYNSQDRALALAPFSAQRASTTALLRLLPDSAWERTALHPEHGTMTVYDLFMLYLNHAEIHLQQIERLKKAMATAS